MSLSSGRAGGLPCTCAMRNQWNKSSACERLIGIHARPALLRPPRLGPADRAPRPRSRGAAVRPGLPSATPRSSSRRSPSTSGATRWSSAPPASTRSCSGSGSSTSGSPSRRRWSSAWSLRTRAGTASSRGPSSASLLVLPAITLVLVLTLDPLYYASVGLDTPGRRPASPSSPAPGMPWLQASTSAWRSSPLPSSPSTSRSAHPPFRRPDRGGAGRRGHSPCRVCMLPRGPLADPGPRPRSRSLSRRPRSRSRSASSATGSSTSHPWPVRRSSSGSRSGCSSSTARARGRGEPGRQRAPRRRGRAPRRQDPRRGGAAAPAAARRSSPPAGRPRPRCTTPIATAPSPSRRPRSRPERTGTAARSC